MELLFKQKVTVQPENVDDGGCLKLSAILQYAQQAADCHCRQLGFDWDTMMDKGLFWAVLRHRIQIERLPCAGEALQVETWPMPMTRTAYPRMVRAVGADGQVLFSVISLWTLMDVSSRAMVLPGKSGVDVPGTVQGWELELPASLPPVSSDPVSFWTVSDEDLDINGHVNNARYLDRIQTLPGTGDAGRRTWEVTVCYLAECRLGQEIQLKCSGEETGILTVDGCRVRTDVPGKTERVFSVRLCYK